MPSELAESIANGTLAQALKNRTKYMVTGISIGAAAGIVLASITGKCKFCLGFWGAAIGGSSGYLIGTKPKEKNEQGQRE